MASWHSTGTMTAWEPRTSRVTLLAPKRIRVHSGPCLPATDTAAPSAETAPSWNCAREDSPGRPAAYKPFFAVIGSCFTTGFCSGDAPCAALSEGRARPPSAGDRNRGGRDQATDRKAKRYRNKQTIVTN